MPTRPAGADSSEGMKAAVWGPPLWRVLHIMASNYDPSRKVGRGEKGGEAGVSSRAAYKLFFDSLGDTLPCARCRENYARSRRVASFRVRRSGHGSPYSSRKSMQWYVYYLHDTVNKDLGKKSPPFSKVIRDCEKCRAKASP